MVPDAVGEGDDDSTAADAANRRLSSLGRRFAPGGVDVFGAATEVFGVVPGILVANSSSDVHLPSSFLSKPRRVPRPPRLGPFGALSELRDFATF